MDRKQDHTQRRRAEERSLDRWRPDFEVICLACEISAYAPDEGDRPLF